MGKCERKMTFGILKMINHKVATLAEAQRLATYIRADKATAPELVVANYLSKESPCSSLQKIESRLGTHTMGQRLFKQCVFSFGCPDLDPKTALDVTNEIFAGFFIDYPWFAAIHTNVPKRVHAHCMLSTANLKTKKRLSQSKQDLQDFKNYYNTVVMKYGLPGLKGKDNLFDARTNQVEATDSSFNSSAVYFDRIDGSYLMEGNSMINQGYYSQPMEPAPSSNIINPVLNVCDVVDKEFTRYFNLGMRGHF